MSRSDQIALTGVGVAIIAAIPSTFGMVMQSKSASIGEEISFAIFLIALVIVALSVWKKIYEIIRPLPPVSRLIYADLPTELEVEEHTLGVNKFFPGKDHLVEADKHRAFWRANNKSLVIFRDRSNNKYRGSFFLIGLSESATKSIMSGYSFIADLSDNDVLEYDRAHTLLLAGMTCRGGQVEASVMLFEANRRVEEISLLNRNIKLFIFYSVDKDHENLSTLFSMKESIVSRINRTGRRLWSKELK